eukprot:m51a1_g11703 hypothetical protein (271) ;mRNA; f:42789-43644
MDHLSSALSTLTEATRVDAAGLPGEALTLYEKGLNLLARAAAAEPDPQRASYLASQARQYLDRAAALRTLLDVPSTRAAPAPEPAASEGKALTFQERLEKLKGSPAAAAPEAAAARNGGGNLQERAAQLFGGSTAVVLASEQRKPEEWVDPPEHEQVDAILRQATDAVLLGPDPSDEKEQAPEPEAGQQHRTHRHHHKHQQKKTTKKKKHHETSSEDESSPSTSSSSPPTSDSDDGDEFAKRERAAMRKLALEERQRKRAALIKIRKGKM